MNELSMKSDKKLPNLKVPVKGKKGVSKFMRKKLASTAKDDINASVQSADRKPEKYMKPDGKMGIRMVKVDKEVIKKESVGKTAGDKSYYHLQRAKELAKKDGHDYDKLPKYDRAKPHQDHYHDKAKNESSFGDNSLAARLIKIRSHPKVKAARKAHAAGTWDGNVDKEGEAVVHINGKPHTVTNKYGKKKNEGVETIKTRVGERPKGVGWGLHRSGQQRKEPHDIWKRTTKKVAPPRFKKKTNEAINHDDAHRDAQTHSDGSMSVKKIPSMIKKSGDKHLHLHMKSYHKEKDGQDFAKKHGYKVKNYVKTPSGTRMDIHKEAVNEIVDPMDLRGRPKKRDPYPKSPYGMKHPLHPLNIQKRKEKEKQKKAAAKKEGVEEAKTFDYFDNRDDAHAHAKKHGGKVFVNTGKGATKVKGKPVNTHVVIKKEEVDVDEALTMQQRIKKRRDMKRNKARIAVGRRRAKKKMANMKVIKKRSDRQARNAIAKKITRGVSKRDLTPARKKEIEKRLESPALKMRIKRLSKRMFKDVRKKEVMRKKG